MNNRIKWVPWLFVALTFTAACSILNNLNPFKGLTSEIEDMVDELPLDEIQQEIDNISTDLPMNLDNITDELETLTTDLPEGVDSLATDLPSEIDEILGDFEGIIDDVIGSENIPNDIPIVDGELGDLFGSENVVSYQTPLNLDTVLSFYQEQMVVNGWETKDGNVITADAALLYFEKNNREATITLSHSAGENITIVMIIIQEKQ